MVSRNLRDEVIEPRGIGVSPLLAMTRFPLLFFTSGRFNEVIGPVL
jgi:hypothetical protein